MQHQAKFATWKNLPLKYRSNFFICWCSSSSAIITTKPSSSITLVSRRSSVVVVVVVLQNNNNNKYKCVKKMETFFSSDVRVLGLVRVSQLASLFAFPVLESNPSARDIRSRVRSWISVPRGKKAFLPLRCRGVLSSQSTMWKNWWLTRFVVHFYLLCKNYCIIPFILDHRSGSNLLDRALILL